LRPPIPPWPLRLPLLLSLLRVAAPITFRAVGGLFTGLSGVIPALFLITALGGVIPALFLIAALGGGPPALFLIAALGGAPRPSPSSYSCHYSLLASLASSSWLLGLEVPNMFICTSLKRGKKVSTKGNRKIQNFGMTFANFST
jgi:hypothetical protein